jgi:hypothetical protein
MLFTLFGFIITHLSIHLISTCLTGRSPLAWRAREKRELCPLVWISLVDCLYCQREQAADAK